MKRIMTAAALAFAMAWFCLQSPLGVAQPAPAPELRNDKVVIDYYEPRREIYMPYYERFQRRKTLEEFAQLLAPVKWKKKLRVQMKDCPSDSNLTGDIEFASPFYNPLEYSLVLCYQWFRILEFFAPTGNDPSAFVTRGEALVGGFVGVVLHEAGHAIFDIQEIPRMGAEEDGADQIAAFIGLQFGKDVSRTVIKGIAHVWSSFEGLRARGGGRHNFADTHSQAKQRFYTTLCIGYGADAPAFQDFVDRGLLPKSRAEGCKQEYEQAKLAFDETILKKYVDQDMMRVVQTKKWFTPEDFR